MTLLKEPYRNRIRARSVIPIIVFVVLALVLLLLIWSSATRDNSTGRNEKVKGASLGTNKDGIGDKNGGIAKSEIGSESSLNSSSTQSTNEESGVLRGNGDNLGKAHSNSDSDGGGINQTPGSGFDEGTPLGRKNGVASVAGETDEVMEDAAAEKIFFEGRWIEKAVNQRQEEMYLQRAYKELENEVLKKYGKHAHLSPYSSESTTSTVLETKHSYLVIGKLTVLDGGSHRMIAEILRSQNGTWRVKQIERIKLE